MKLFTLKKQPVCSCSKEVPAFSENEAVDHVKIAVLGSGCKSCYQLYENLMKVIESEGLNEKPVYITDMRKIAQYGVMSTPALVINNKVAAAGKVLNPEQIKEILKTYEIK